MRRNRRSIEGTAASMSARSVFRPLWSFAATRTSPVSCACGPRPGPRYRRVSTVRTKIVERPFRPSLPRAQPIYRKVHADRLGESLGSFKNVYRPTVDGLFRWDVELGRRFEPACVEECHDVVVIRAMTGSRSVETRGPVPDGDTFRLSEPKPGSNVSSLKQRPTNRCVQPH
jgi:hypothetical protein